MKLIEENFTVIKGKNLQQHNKRDLVNAALYRNKTDCQWRLIPSDFPNYATVWSFYRRAVKKGIWKKAMDKMVQKYELMQIAPPEPSYGLIDSQSVKTTNKNENRGFDGKKVNGRKRHIVTDIIGNLFAVKVHAANIHDTMSGCHVYQAAKNKCLSIRGGVVGEGYCGMIVEFVRVKYGVVVDIVERIKSKRWQVLSMRWCVERTFVWAIWSRILSKDYEIKAVYEASVFMVSHLHTLLRRY
jgi:putative transposase